MVINESERYAKFEEMKRLQKDLDTLKQRLHQMGVLYQNEMELQESDLKEYINCMARLKVDVEVSYKKLWQAVNAYQESAQKLLMMLGD